MSDYVSHLADDDKPTTTACGEPWQGWQQPSDADLADPHLVTLPPMEPPRPHRDRIRFCGACQKRAREGT